MRGTHYFTLTAKATSKKNRRIQMYRFTTLDPRNISAAIEANNKIFADPVYGVEVTVPALAIIL